MFGLSYIFLNWFYCVWLILLLFCRETTAVWLSVDVPSAQPPGQYEGELIITAIKADSEWLPILYFFTCILIYYFSLHGLKAPLIVILETCNWSDIHNGLIQGWFSSHLLTLTHHRSTAQCLGKAEKQQLYREFRNCLDILEPIDGKPADEVVGFWSYTIYVT